MYQQFVRTCFMFCFLVKLEIYPNMFVGARGEHFIAQGRIEKNSSHLQNESSRMCSPEIRSNTVWLTPTEVLNLSLNKWNRCKFYVWLFDDEKYFKGDDFMQSINCLASKWMWEVSCFIINLWAQSKNSCWIIRNDLECMSM